MKTIENGYLYRHEDGQYYGTVNSWGTSPQLYRRRPPKRDGWTIVSARIQVDE